MDHVGVEQERGDGMDMLDPKFYVMCDHVIDVNMETQAGVEAAG